MVIFNSYVKLPEDILYIYYIILYYILYIYIYTYSHHVSYMVWFKTNDCFVCNITIILITMIVWTWCFIIITSCCVCIYIYIYISYLHYYFNMSTYLTRKPGRWDLRCGKRSGRSWTWHVSAETGISSDGKVLGKTWAQPWVAHMLHVWNMNPYI